MERQLSKLFLEADIREPADVPPPVSSAFGWLKGAIVAGSTWRGIAFLAVKSGIGFVSLLFLLVFAVFSFGLILAPLGGEVTLLELWTIDTTAEAVLAAPIGLAVLIVSLHVVNGIARVARQIAVALLDGDPPPDPAPRPA